MTKHWKLLILAMTFLAITVQAQPWMSELKTDRGTKPGLEEYREVFDSYMLDKENRRGTGFKQFKRWEWFMNSHLDENGEFNSSAFWNSWQEKQASSRTSLDEADWQEYGPFLTRQFYAGGMGRVNSVAFHPSNPNILYIGAASGGVWKTTDHGETWSPLTDNLPLLGVSDVVVDYSNPDILYLATGDRDGLDIPSIGVMKSTDAGVTWQTTGLSFTVDQGVMVNKLEIHPTNPQILIATTVIDDGILVDRGKIYRTTNGGESWTVVDEYASTATDLDVDPDNPNYWYCGYNGRIEPMSGLSVSSDGGLTWRVNDWNINGGPDEGTNRVEMAVSPVNGSRVYAVASAVNINDFAGFWSSTDHGSNWTLMSDSPNILGWEHDGSDMTGQSFYNLCVVADPDSEQTVYVGAVNVWKSTDAGATWTCISHWLDDTNIPMVHADHHDLIFRGDTLYSCNDGGLYYSTDKGDTWTDISSGLVITQIYRLGIDQTTEDLMQVLNGNQDNGTNLYSDGVWTSEIGGDGMECGFDPVNPDVMYGEVYNGIMLRSQDGGQTWYEINNGAPTNGAWVTPFHISQHTPGRLLKATTGVYVTNDYGDSWQTLAANLWPYPLTILEVAPSTDSTIYAGLNDISYSLIVSHDMGATWNMVDTRLEHQSYVAIHPEDPRTVYVTADSYSAGHKVYRVSNDGASIENISGDLPNVPVHTIVIHPDNPDHLYIGTDVGVYFSPDAGANWEDYSSGLPNVIVTELEIHRNSNSLVASTYGRGMWVTPAMSPVAEDVPSNPSAVVNSEGLVTFSWEQPSGGLTGFVEYIVYKDGSELTRTTSTTITDQLSTYGTYAYQVQASYSDGTSDLTPPREVTWMETAAPEIDTQAIPEHYNLLPAYPNPFNPETTVTLALPEASNVVVKIYNVIGAEVATIHKGKLNSGYHHFTFNASRYVSGVYFIRANVPGKMDVSRKVVLIK